ncbi:hypothetical protein A3860_18470 [Niastella vici]|uniref:Uncharacterized protein n=1 Tax=Niastella vici TaxID=1703345 RepID=A0A1V9G2G0_9BACT|nr:hypothetical protein [Niastella vici]OQP64744.1 hypothetical protein A3860_18470 [Niastella vici]
MRHIFLINTSFGALWDSLASIAIWVLVFWFIAHIFQKINNEVPEAHSNGCHSFDFSFSSLEFYSILENIIKQREMPSITMSRVTHKEGGIFSSDRIYLRISRGPLIYDVCAAPFGNGFFVSSWQGETLDIFRRIIVALPGIGKRLEKAFYSKTYFQADTDAMFHGGVHSCLKSAIETITAAHGIRPISEVDKRDLVSQ